ncbi:hypothetical protein KM043_015698 [Ampulex compressa]|nr:hypothetical protein KM043_015698 [Ampulex compressa]
MRDDHKCTTIFKIMSVSCSTLAYTENEKLFNSFYGIWIDWMRSKERELQIIISPRLSQRVRNFLSDTYLAGCSHIMCSPTVMSIPHEYSAIDTIPTILYQAV